MTNSVTIKHHYSLRGHNTFGLDVKAKQFISYHTVDELVEVLACLRDKGEQILHIGGGSNLLFTKDYEGSILHSDIRFIQYVSRDSREVVVRVGSGVKWDDFCAEMASSNYYGCENLSYIPGEVGASAIQNIGAYGVEAGDVIDKVFCIEASSGKEVVFRASECAYGYRDSRFKHEKGRYIVTRVTFRLTRRYCPSLGYGNIKAALEGRDLEALTPLDVRDAIIRIRREKLPDPAEIGSAGSFFKNPVISKEHFDRILASVPDGKVPHFDLPDGTVKVPAAWMIDTCGFRGAVRGGAKVFEKQPLVIVNDSGSASPEDIIALEDEVIAAVRDRFGVILHPEVEHI